ncbi:hypothetical protein CEXT_394131 [Caerostris extrusa]|uniref:Uncharacterized protein n=1 Tax=Caerostris extrusa TaxID=172846 RepID=A0AAV4QBP7_CAEEX|nr:hypothetical protein CEXT_394131 [Caerostris extrusa]
MTHVWEEREREEIIIAPHLFERKEIMADNPEKPGPIQTCRWREERFSPHCYCKRKEEDIRSQTKQKQCRRER